jgi:hypothetical protein
MFAMDEVEPVNYSGAPATPRGANGELEGDRLDVIKSMPKPEDAFFVVLPMFPEAGAGVVLRPTPTLDHSVSFPNRDEARDVAEKLCREQDAPFGVYGPYESLELIKTKPWLHPRSTPCDTYEMLEVIVRKEYFPRDHPRAGHLKGAIKQTICNHVDFGFVAPSKNVIEDPTALRVTGSMLTSYLDDEGNLICDNVGRLQKPNNEWLNDTQLARIARNMRSAHKTRLDALVDQEFRKALPDLAHLNMCHTVPVQFALYDKELTLIHQYEVKEVLPKKLPFHFAHALRMAVQSFYGKCTSIGVVALGHPVSSKIFTLYEDNV